MHTQDDPPDDGDKLKNVIKTNQIRLNISIRMRDGISHTSLSGKIHHNGRSVLLEYIITASLSAKSALMKVNPS